MKLKILSDLYAQTVGARQSRLGGWVGRLWSLSLLPEEGLRPVRRGEVVLGV